jgi:RNase H-fold protein (predicted Holliday junction resolvase)
MVTRQSCPCSRRMPPNTACSNGSAKSPDSGRRSPGWKTGSRKSRRGWPKSKRALVDAQNALQAARKQLDDLQEQAHAIQVETLKLAQALERFRERQAQIDASLEEMAAEEEAENERLFIAEEAIDAAARADPRTAADMSRALARLEQAERALRDERERVNAVERELREAQFSQRECRGKIEEIANNRALAQQADRPYRRGTGALRGKRGGHAGRGSRTEAAGRARAAGRLRTGAGGRARRAGSGHDACAALEEQRMKVELGLEPLRERIGELRLKEQAAALNVEQLAAQLQEVQGRRSQPDTRTGRRYGPGRCRARSPVAALDRSAGRGQPRGAGRTRIGTRAQGLPGFAVGRPDAGDGNAGKRHPAHRPGNARSAAVDLRRGEQELRRAVSRSSSAAAKPS